MPPAEDLSRCVAEALAECLPLSADEVAGLIEVPPDPQMGDYALPCFTLAKQLRKAPNAIAAELQQAVALPEGVREARAVGPYLNFFVDRPWMTEAVLSCVRAEGDRYGSSEVGHGETVVIEYSSPNIAKHLSVYHLRSAIIGNSLSRIYGLLGYSPFGINFLGDWGTGFGKLVAAFEQYECGAAEDLSVADLQELYVRFSRDAEENADLQQAARDAFRRLEEGDPAAVGPWEAFKAVSLREYERVYSMLGISFDRYSSESSYADRLQPRLQRMREDGKAMESEGALVIPLDDANMPPCMVQKSDGASLYATRDICAAEDRWDEFHFARMLYVVGGEQTLYFNQLKAALSKLGHDWADRIEHINFGMMRFLDPETGKATTGSTRRGVTILLDEVLDEAVAKAREKIDQNADRFEPDTDRDELAAQVGIGAVVFGDLSVRRMRDVVFDWDKMLDFEGDTGPYVQYAHARLCSIMRKAGEERPDRVDCARLDMPEEWVLVRHLSRFPDAVRRAGAENEPSVIAGYLLELCADFSSYYSAGMRDAALRVLCDDEATRAARLALVEAARQVIRTGLGLLGIAAPERM
jgi:arginyl-tRNA synthetase